MKDQAVELTTTITHQDLQEIFGVKVNELTKV